MATRKRIRSQNPNVSGGGTPVVTPASITIGGDWGTTNQQVEAHIATTYQYTGRYAFSEELSLGVKTQQTFFTKPQKPELHMTGTMAAPPQFEASVKTTNGTLGTSAIAFTGVSTVIGQMLLAVVGNQSGTTFATPAGWTSINETPNATINVASYRRFVVGGDPSSYTFTFPTAAVNGGVIAAFSNVDSTTPINASATSTGSSTAVTVPSVTPTLPRAMLTACVLQDGAAAPTFVIPSPYTDRQSYAVTGVGANLGGDVATHIQNTSGASGTVTVNTGLTLAAAWSAQHIAINGTNKVLA